MSDIRSTTLYDKTLGCLLGGLIGDAIGTPTEGKRYEQIEEQFGWVADFDGDGTDDTVMKTLLADALVRTQGLAGCDDWARVWLDRWDAIFGKKVGKFFQSVLHTAAKLRRHSVPRMAALGNMPSSSSAMAISPIGIVNAARPRLAAAQAYDVAALIHIHDVAFCQDGAAAMAAAVAEAFRPGATVQSVLEAAQAYIPCESGAEMLELIDGALAVARRNRDYKAFRKAYYAEEQRFFRRITCDSRETVPETLALFLLSGGDVEKMVTYGANFGRDADTIATMGGAIAGAFSGTGGIRADWIAKANAGTDVDQEKLAEDLARTAVAKYELETGEREAFAAVAGR
jgi:ADP-ribosylglycohydrolase